MKKQLLILIFILTGFTLTAQKLYKCDDTTAYWTSDKEGLYYSIKLKGFAKETERKNVISVGDYVLQHVTVEKKEYIKDGDDSDLSILVHYALGEGEYLSGTFEQKIDIKLEKALVTNGQDALFWSFDLPAEYNNEVKSQLFINVVVGDMIVGLSSSQFNGQEFDDVKAYLIATIATLKKAEKKSDLEHLCVTK